LRAGERFKWFEERDPANFDYPSGFKMTNAAEFIQRQVGFDEPRCGSLPF
jgi:hypothetical protein